MGGPAGSKKAPEARTEAFRPVGELMSRVPAWDLPRAPLDEMMRAVKNLVLENDGC